MKNTIFSNKKVYFSLVVTILFIFIFINSASAVSLTNLESTALASSRGTGGLIFDSTGTKLLAFDNWRGVKPNFVTQYTLNTAYNLSTLVYTGLDTNLTPIFPSLYENYSLSVAYITIDGNHAYFILTNTSDEFNSFTVHRTQNVILHYTLNNFNISSLTYADMFLINKTGINFYSPHLDSIFVSSDGSKMVLGGRWYNITETPRFENYNLSTAYTVSSALYTSVYPFSFYDPSYYSYESYNNVWFSPDFQMTAVLGNDIKQAQYSIKIAHLLLNGGQTDNVIDNFLTRYEGMTVVAPFGTVYLFAQTGGNLKKFYVSNIVINGTLPGFTQIGLTAEQNNFMESFVNPLLAFFPEAQDISSRQKIFTVLMVMFLTAVALLYGGSQLSSDGLHSLMLYVVLGLLFIEFIFFITIEYIGIGTLILITLLGIGVAYLSFRGKGG